MTLEVPNQQDEEQIDREFESLVRELEMQIAANQDKDTCARDVSLSEIKQDFEAIHKTWRRLETYGRPISNSVRATFSKRTTLLAAEIVRRIKVRRRISVAVTTIIIAGGAAILFWLSHYLYGRDFARRLEQAVSNREVRQVEALLRHAASEPARLDSVAVQTSVASAEAFLKTEFANLSHFEDCFNQLPSTLSPDASVVVLARIAVQFGSAQKALDALSPDLQSENSPRLQSYESRWRTFVSDCSNRLNQSYLELVTAAELQSTHLDYLAAPETVTEPLQLLRGMANQLQAFTSEFTNYFAARSDLPARARSVHDKFLTYEKEWTHLELALAEFRHKPETFSDYTNALRMLAGSRLSASPAVRAAATAQSLDPNPDTVLMLLLGITNVQSWRHVTQNPSSLLFPETALPEEINVFRELKSDTALGADHRRYRFWLDKSGSKTVDWITIGALQNSEGWNRIEAYVSSDTSTRCSFGHHEYGWFGGQLKISVGQPIYRIQASGDLDDTAAFQAMALERFLGANGSYQRPLLQGLDMLRAFRDGSVICRAYLFLRITEIMAMQPDDWGLSFAPSVSKHRATIEGIAGGELQSGDWYVTEKVRSLTAPLLQLFDSIGELSYEKQARGFLYLARETAAAGLEYVGYATPEGEAVLVQPTGNAEVWGYRSGTARPTKIGQSRNHTVEFAPGIMPLSPMFVLRMPIDRLLARASVEPTDNSFKTELPPLVTDALRRTTKP